MKSHLNQRKQSTNSPLKKNQIPEDSKLTNFFYMIIVYILKKFVFTPTHVKIGIYFIALLLCSLLKDFQQVPLSYFSLKTNIFNQYFVKLAWGWTLLLLTPFIIMTSSVYTGGNPYMIRKQLTRIGIATFIWYISTSIFEYIDQRTGMCTNRNQATKLVCKLNKHEWINGFDISGHTFILMHALFFMLEEVKVFYKWDAIRQKLLDNSNNSTNSDLNRVRKYYNAFTPYIKINFILLALFTLLWEIMLLSTFLYFHSILQKLIAAFIAVICWFLTYNVYYISDQYFFSPGLPGLGVV